MRCFCVLLEILLTHSVSEKRETNERNELVEIVFYLNAENHLLLTMLWMQSITLFFYYCTKVSMQCSWRNERHAEKKMTVKWTKPTLANLCSVSTKIEERLCFVLFHLFLPLFVFRFERWVFENENNNKSWQPNRKTKNLCKHTVHSLLVWCSWKTNELRMKFEMKEMREFRWKAMAFR